MGRKLEDPEGTRTKFYYVRMMDKSKFPVITVCLKHDPELALISRGISICNLSCESEQKRSRKVGRGIAEDRARYAMHHQKNNLKIGGKALDTMAVEAFMYFDENNISWLCDHNPVLTKYEREILRVDENDLLLPLPLRTSSPAIFPVEDGWIRKLIGTFNRAIRDWRGK